MKINAILLSDWQEKRGIIQFERVSVRSFCEIKKRRKIMRWELKDVNDN